MAKTCSRCGNDLKTGETYYCEECRQIVRQEFLEKEKASDGAAAKTDNSKPANSNGAEKETVNSIGVVLKTLGIVVIGLSVIAGIVVGSIFGDSGYYGSSFNWQAAFATMIGGAFNGLLIMAIGEIIILLQTNNNRLNTMLKLMKNQNDDN